MKSNGLVAVADTDVFVLGGSVPISGRISWISADATGHARIHCYLVVDGGCAMLIDTGLPVHDDLIIRQIESVVTEDTQLSMLLTRVVEFDSLGNAAAIAHAFPVTRVYANFDATEWLSYHPKFDGPGGLPASVDPNIEFRIFREGTPVEVGDGRNGPRQLDIVHSPLRLLATAWVYDRESRILFTSDAFGHVTVSSETSPPVVDETTDTTTFEVVRDHLFTKFEWLLAADTSRIRSELAEIFERYEIDAIAPIYGCVIEGRRLVARHYEMVQRALAEVEVGALR